MRLLELELSNWKCHRRLIVDLRHGLEISGRNGTGKSSILEAVRYCFVSGERGVKQRITNGERSLSVKLSFELDGKNYVITKNNYQDKPSKAQLTVDGTQVADNPTSVSEELSKIMDESVWDRLLYVPQGGLTTFVEELGGKEGRKKFDALFGLDKLERVWTSAGERIREQEARAKTIREELARYPKNAETEYEMRERELSETAEKTTAEVKHLEEKLAETIGRVRGVEEEIRAISEAKKKRQELSDKLGKLEVEIAKKQKDFESAEQKLAQLASTKKQVGQLLEKTGALAKYPKILEKLTEVASLREKLESFKNLDAEEKKVYEKKESIKKEAGLKDALDKSRTELRKLEDYVTTVKHDLSAREDYLRQMKSLKGQLKCPRCKQKLTESHLALEVETTEKEIKRLTEWLFNIKGKVDGEKDMVEGLEKKAERISEIKAQLKVEEKNVSEKTRERDKTRNELESGENALKLLGYANQEKSIVEANAKEFSEAKTKLKILEEEVREGEGAAADSAKLKTELTALEEEKKKTADEAGKTEFNEQAHEKLLSDKEGLSERKYALDVEIKEKNFLLKEAGAKIKENKEKKRSYLEVKARIEETEKKVRLLSRAREVFHTDKGLPKYLRDKYVGQLGTLLSRYFKQFNQNPTYKEAVFDRDYNIRVKSTNGVLSLAQLSGGERVQLAVALRIALIELLSPTRTLILDEPFGSLDENHRELLGELLNKMAETWQLTVVTHVPVDSLNLPKLELEGY